ncbi:MAG TPA: hypothetical protein VGM91_19070 [Conexibacter sp.]
MHTTTVRFDEETWTALSEVCDRDGIAKAQYVREATVARLASSVITPVVQRQAKELGGLRRRVERLERIVVRRRPPTR